MGVKDAHEWAQRVKGQQPRGGSSVPRQVTDAANRAVITSAHQSLKAILVRGDHVIKEVPLPDYAEIYIHTNAGKVKLGYQTPNQAVGRIVQSRCGVVNLDSAISSAKSSGCRTGVCV